MYLHEAVKRAGKTGKYIVRKSTYNEHCGYKLMPTNTGDNCIVVPVKGLPTRGWQPNADDLAADDWMLIG